MSMSFLSACLPPPLYCDVLWCYAMLCYAMLCLAVSLSANTLLCYAVSCLAMLTAVLCSAMPDSQLIQYYVFCTLCIAGCGISQEPVLPDGD